MNQSSIAPSNPKQVTINGQSYNLIAFYYPDRNASWDTLYHGQFLANFFPCSFSLTINDVTASFHNAEAAFQATKWWNNPADLAMFEAAKTGTEAFHIKKGLHNPDGSYASLGRDGAMKAVLAQKFSAPSFQQALLATGDAYLLEHNEVKGRDDYWSDDHDGSGQNMLGQTLMALRQKLGGAGAPAGNYSVADFTVHV
ncbi:MAG: NADAR family protein [Acidobacteriota bacterium]|nr:NADAR family protein [Acidobacteriota bacterium]